MKHPDIQKFFSAISTWQDAYSSAKFTFLARKSENKLNIIQARLLLNGEHQLNPLLEFENQDIVAGQFYLSEMKTNPSKFLEKLLSGNLQTIKGDLFFDPDIAGYDAYFQPFHPEGLRNQNRLNVLTISGKIQLLDNNTMEIDWGLKASSKPYDNLNDLMHDFHLGQLRTDKATIEIVAHSIIVVDLSTKVTDETAEVAVKMFDNLDINKISIGYRVFSNALVVERGGISGLSINWKKEGDYLRGCASVKVPKAAVVQAYAIYNGVAHSQGWIVDPTTAQNNRRSTYETFDSELRVLEDILINTPKNKSREFETAVSWLIWMLGYNPIHIGGVPKVQEAADIIATTPKGNYIVVECTVGLLKADNKLANLFERTQRIISSLQNSNNSHLRVLPVIITAKPRDEVIADLDQAERLGIYVLTRENIQEALSLTRMISDADKDFAECEDRVQTILASKK